MAAAGLDLGDEPFHTVADPDKSLSRDVDVVCSFPLSRLAYDGRVVLRLMTAL